MHEVVRGGDAVREKVERGCAEAGSELHRDIPNSHRIIME